MGKTKISRKCGAILLGMLLKGYPIVKNNKTYVLSEDYYLCQIAVGKDNRGKEKEVLLKIGMGNFGLKEFIDWANSFTTEELAINASVTVLNDLKRGD